MTRVVVLKSAGKKSHRAEERGKECSANIILVEVVEYDLLRWGG